MALAEFTGINRSLNPASSNKTLTAGISITLAQGAFRYLYMLVQYEVGDRVTGNGG